MTKTNPINLIKEYMNMKTIFANIDAKLAEMNIKPGKWSAWLDRVSAYWKDYWNNTPGFVAKACKLVHDTWDYVSYNACSFIGGLFCAYILF